MYFLDHREARASDSHTWHPPLSGGTLYPRDAEIPPPLPPPPSAPPSSAPFAIAVRERNAPSAAHERPSFSISRASIKEGGERERGGGGAR